ncbi:MAG: glycosyltransferase family 2 protein [Bacteroidales bacterium]|nr:glycosyltransferase family 2 protein [Bacteroidales bacterium]
MNKISVVIITMNEERNIERCLQSVLPIADEVVVVDSFSEDATEEICTQYNARFVSHAWEGYSGSKNFADGLASHELILSIDGDEALSETLTQSIKALKEREIADNEVFAMNRLNNYCGRWIKGCGFYPDTKVRIWRKDFARWEGLIHEWLVYESTPKTTLLKGDLLHYSWATPEDFRKQQFHFAELGAKSYYERGKKTSFLPWLFSPSINFIRTYIFKGGFLYGKTGLHICRTLRQANRHKYNLLRSLSKKQ